jgi:hypothetical protein
MNNNPLYKIHGKERKELKNQRSKLNSFIRNYWQMHQMDKDMAYFFNISESVMSDELAQIQYDNVISEIKKIDELLAEHYIQN